MQEESELLITRVDADVAEYCPTPPPATHTQVVPWQLEVISSRRCMCVRAYLSGQEPFGGTLFKSEDVRISSAGISAGCFFTADPFIPE